MEPTSKVFKTPEKKRAKARAYMAELRKDPKYKKKFATYQRQYRIDNREQLTVKGREYQRKNALYIQLQRKGLTLEDYDRVVKRHGGVCDICGGPPDGRWSTFTLDHCHKTGVLRGLLCSKCNRGVGFFKDDPQLMQKAIKYLRRK